MPDFGSAATQTSPQPQKMKYCFVLILASFLVGIGVAINPPNLAFAEVITPQMRTEDARLERPVHPLVAPRITVSALLDKLSQAEGVEIVLHGSPKGLGETEVFAVLRPTPLADNLNGLCTLLSYDKGRWRWTREGTAGHYRYVLWPWRGMDQLVAEVQEQIQADFESQDAKIHSALTMSPKELEEAAKTNTNLTYIFLEDKAGFNKHRFLLDSFYKSFPPDQRLRVLRGEVLTPIKPIINTVDSHAAPLVFRAVYTADSITPVLYVGTKDGAFYSCIGNGLEDELWRNHISNLWYFGGKQKFIPLEDKVVQRPAKLLPLPAELTPEADSNNLGDRFSPLWPLLWKTSEATSLSILAVPTEPLPKGVGLTSAFDFPTEPYSMTLKALMDKLNRPFYSLRYQCQPNVLLLRDTSAPFSRRAPQAN